MEEILHRRSVFLPTREVGFVCESSISGNLVNLPFEFNTDIKIQKKNIKIPVEPNKGMLIK